jgi:hypothetical protein
MIFSKEKVMSESIYSREVFNGGQWDTGMAELRQDEERRKNAAARNMLDAAWANRNTPTLDKLVGRDDKATGDARYAGLSGARWQIGEYWAGAPLTSEEVDELNRPNVGESAGFAEVFEKTKNLIAGRNSCLIAFGLACESERTRILAALQSLKPRIRPSHGDWARAWREEAALDMWNKVVALVAQEAPKGE